MTMDEELMALIQRIDKLEADVQVWMDSTETRIDVIESQQEVFFRATNRAIEDLQKSVNRMGNDLRALVAYNEHLLPVIKDLKIWLAHGGRISDRKE